MSVTTIREPDLWVSVKESNIAAGNNDIIGGRSQVNLEKGFSIITGTLTNMTVTVSAFNDEGQEGDITNDLFGVASLSSNTAYIADIKVPVKGVIVRYARTNATNAANFTVLFAQR